MNRDLQVIQAAAFACTCHTGQTRRDGVTPYFRHVAVVAHRVRRKYRHDDAAEMVAWLHDVLEDCPAVTQETLKARGFPAEVVEAVVAITKLSGAPYDAYLERVAANPLARKVKVEDILANLSDDPTPAQVAKYAKALQFLSAGPPVESPS